MKKSTCLILFCLFCLVQLNLVAQLNEQKDYKTEYVIILVIDGLRYSEGFGDSTYQYIPNLKNKLSKKGVFYPNFYNNGHTLTVAGHTAITTGNYQCISNSGKTLPKQPSIFQYYLKTSGESKTETWVFSGKDKLEVLTNTKNKDWWNEYLPMSYCGVKGNSAKYGSDQEMWQFAKKIYKNHPPKLSLINLLSVDANGHQNDWEGYLNAIKYCDKIALELWKLIQASPEMKDKTTLFITNDHGRHLDGVKNGFVSHGDGCEGCRHIMLLAIGPDFKQNSIVKQPAEMIDISKTIAALLHFKIPTSDGEILEGLFK